MEILLNIRNWLIAIIPTACVVRILYLLNQMNADENEVPGALKKIKNIIKFMIIALCIGGMLLVCYKYFGYKPIW